MSLTPETRARLAGLYGLIPNALGERLAELASGVRHDHAIVELGSFCGKSTAYLAAGSQAGDGAPVFAIDPWDRAGNPGGRFQFAAEATRLRFRAQLFEAGFSASVTAFRAFSLEMAQVWQRPVGLLYIDGSHTEKDVRADWQAWEPHLAPGAIVAFDDYRTKNNPGVAIVVDAIRARGGRWEEGPAPLIVGYR